MSVVVRRAAADDLDPVRFVGLATWPATYGAIKGARYVTRGLDEYWSAVTILEQALRNLAASAA